MALIEYNPRSTPSNGLHSTQRYLDGAVVLSISGEVDLANASSLRAQLKAAIETRKHLIVVDLKDLRYIDSCGIHALLDTHHAVARNGCSIALAAVPSMVQRIFKIVGLAQMIPVFPTVETAVESLRRGENAAGGAALHQPLGESDG